jgi:hypothetical protein
MQLTISKKKTQPRGRPPPRYCKQKFSLQDPGKTPEGCGSSINLKAAYSEGPFFDSIRIERWLVPSSTGRFTTTTPYWS